MHILPEVGRTVNQYHRSMALRVESQTRFDILLDDVISLSFRKLHGSSFTHPIFITVGDLNTRGMSPNVDQGLCVYKSDMDHRVKKEKQGEEEASAGRRG